VQLVAYLSSPQRAQAAGIAIDDFESMMEVQRMKEKLCLMGKPPSSSSEEFAMPDGKVVDGALVKAAQTVPAKLAFAPSKLDIEHELFGTPTQYEKGLDTLALDSLGICSIENRTELMRNTILIGVTEEVFGSISPPLYSCVGINRLRDAVACRWQLSHSGLRERIGKIDEAETI
jgi:hypothetical protein